MTRTRVRHRCEACGATTPRWLGRCPGCAEWGTLLEEPDTLPGPLRTAARTEPARPVPLAAVDPVGATRRPTGVGELDRVLGGGLVPGSVTLLGGEPGIGKSTLLLQALGRIAATGAPALLVCAEESPEQVRMRAGRVGALADTLLVLGETSLPHTLAHVEVCPPAVLAVDSIQAVVDPDVPGAPGSLSQVRECAQQLVRLAKETGIAVVLVGHVTKDGALAGPRALEHIVDTVLSFEGDRHHALRLLHPLKHRFGTTGELGVFEMAGDGLRDVPDPSVLFLADRRAEAPGSVVTVVLEGARPLLVEVQALVTESTAPMSRRSAQGVEAGRLALILAVLGKRAACPVPGDVYVSAAGGVRVTEPAADLAVALALAGALTDVALAPDLVVLGEVGLGGELRQVRHLDRRLAEAARLGFRRALVPRSAPEARGVVLLRAGDLAEAVVLAGLPPRVESA